MRYFLGIGALALLLAPASSPAFEATVIGAVERVVLLPWGIALRARVDTGAAVSSLDARGIRTHGGMVSFRFPKALGGRRVTVPLAYLDSFETSQGSEIRPVVFLEMCLGKKRVRTRVNLNDRSGLKFPLLLGRDALKDGFLVDVSREYVLEPACGPSPGEGR